MGTGSDPADACNAARSQERVNDKWAKVSSESRKFLDSKNNRHSSRACPRDAGVYFWFCCTNCLNLAAALVKATICLLA